MALIVSVRMGSAAATYALLGRTQLDIVFCAAKLVIS